MLAQLSQTLQHSARARHLLFFCATLSTVLLIGYNFGTFDEAMHIPFLKAEANPGMYDGDTLIGLHSIYYSYFWHFFVPVLQAGWLEPALFTLHMATLYLSFWAIWNLSQTLFGDPLTSFFSVVGFIVPHFGFSGFPVLEFAPLSRTFVLPFLLIALDQFLQRRIPLAFLITGLMYNIHVVSVNFILAMFGLACLLELRRIGLRNLALSALLFLASAAPVLLWKASGDPVDFSLRPEWLAFLNNTLFFHLFAMFRLDYPGTWAIVLGGVSTLGLYFAARRETRRTPAIATAGIFIHAGIVVLLTHLAAVYFLPVTILIQSQIARVGTWIMILAYLFFANALAKRQARGDLSQPALALLAGAFFLSPSPILPLAAWGIIQTRRERLIRAAGVILPFLTIASFATVWTMGFWNPGIYVYGQPTPWVEAQRWARDNTPPDARFITPPEKWGPQESDWRVHSERASVGTLSEILVAAFQPGYEIEWKTRFTIIAPGALEQFNGNYFHNVKVTRAAYYRLSTPELLEIACALDAQYAVAQKPHQHPLPVVYENSEFTIYSLETRVCQ
jgi:hypothetical protein